MSLPSRTSRLAATGAAIAIFLLLFFIWAGPSWAICLYRLTTDGTLTLLWLLCAAGIGETILRPCRSAGEPPTGDLLRFVTAIALGIGVMSLIALGLGLIGWLNRATAIALLVGGVLLLIVHWQSHWIWLRDWARAPAGLGWVWLLAMLPASAAMIGALLPPGVLWGDEPNGYDVIEYHLQVPRQWYEANRVTPLAENVFSYFPQGVEMHYLLAMEIRGGPWAGMYLAQFMHVAMCALAAATVGAAAGNVAGVIVAVTPWVLLLGPVAYVEGGTLFFGALALAWAMRAIGRHGIKEMLLAGIMCGFACGTKLTNIPMLLAAIPVALVIAERKVNFRKIGAFLIVAILILSPWLIRTAAWTGNPVFPQAMTLLGHGHFSPIQVERWRRAYVPTLGRLAALNVQVLLDWRYGFALLPAAAAAAIAAGRKHHASQFLLAMLLLVAFIWLGFTHLQSRFFVVAIPIAAMLIGQIKRPAWSVGLICFLLATGAAPIGGKLIHFLKFDRQLQQAGGVGLLGLENLTGLRGPAGLPEEGHVDLVGDAGAFLYPVPMSRLSYRTVFDVDTSDAGKSIVQDWLGRDEVSLAGHMIVIDPGELARFSRTYYAIPPLTDDQLKKLATRPDVKIIGAD